MQKTKILYVITKSNFGGAQRYVYDLATSLSKDKFDVSVACGGNGTLVEMLKEKNVPVYEIKSFQRDIHFGKEFFSILELRKLYKQLRPDVVHLNSSKAGGLGAFVARISRIPKIIFTAHGWPFWEPRNIFQKMLIYFFSWLTIAFTHKTICISQNDAEIGRNMLFVGRKIKLIRNAITPYDLLPRETARMALFEQHEIDKHKDDVWVLTNAELTRNKNIISGINSVILHNKTAKQKIYYCLMGDGELHDEIAQHIRHKDAGQFVKMLGFIPNGRAYYKAFDVFFLPSLKEGVPYVLLEAGVAELPCVATLTGGIPEVIEGGKNGFVKPPEDISALADALKNLTNDPQLREKFGAEHKKKVFEEYSVQKMLDATTELYR